MKRKRGRKGKRGRGQGREGKEEGKGKRGREWEGSLGLSRDRVGNPIWNSISSIKMWKTKMTP